MIYSFLIHSQGFIHDLSGAYDSGFQIIGTLVVLSGLMLIFIPICNHFESLKKWFFYWNMAYKNNETNRMRRGNKKISSISVDTRSHYIRDKFAL